VSDATLRKLNGSLFARLLFDVMMPAELAEAIRDCGYDVSEARALPLAVQQDDTAILENAAQERRVVVTCNYHDPHSNFCSLHDQWQAQGRDHAGILLIPQFHISNRFLRWQVRDRMLRLFNQHTWDDLYNQVWWLP